MNTQTKDFSSYKLWREQVLPWKAQFSLVVISIVLMIPLSLGLLVLLPHTIQTINSTPADIAWDKFLGHSVSLWISPLVEGTSFENGVPLAFQKQWFAIILISISGIYGFLNYYSDSHLRDLGEKIAKKLRSDVCKKYLSLNYSDAATLDAGQLSSMVGEDMREAQQTFTRLVSSLLKDGFTAFVFIIWLVFLDYQLFALFAAILIPTALILRIAGKTLKKLSKRGLQFESDLLSGLLERMRGWQTIKVYKAIAFEIENFNKINTKIYHAWRRATRARTLSSPLIEWLGIIAGTLIVIAALRRTANGELTNNILTSFVVTVGLLSDKINRMSNQLNTTRKGTEALKRMKNFLLTEFEVKKISSDEINTACETLNSIQLKDVSIGNSANHILVKNLNLDLSSGSFVVIVGSSGVGKSTLIRTLLGIQKPIVGEMLINSKPATEACFKHIAKEICFIPQEPFLFTGSIFENIIYPEKIPNPTELNKQLAAEALSLSTLERDLDDNINGLSGGEKQRLMFARIFYHKPKLIVIDEGTSAIDLTNELKIMENLKSHVRESITFVVAHRPAISHFATQILNLSKLVERS